MKSYDELRTFIQTQVGLRTNHQLVILRCLAGHRTAHRGVIAENIAYYNCKNHSDIRQVRRFLNVAALGALEEKGVIAAETRKSRTEYMLNADLNEFEQIEIDRLVEEKLAGYNRRRRIRANPFGGGGIDWGLHADLLKEETHTAAREKAWFWPVTYGGWRAARRQKVCTSRAPPSELKKIGHGDLIVFYLTEPAAFTGVFRVIGRWHAAPPEVLTGTKRARRRAAQGGVSQVRLEPVKLGFARAESLKPFKIGGRVRRAIGENGGSRADSGLYIPAHDMRIIMGGMRSQDARILDGIEKMPEHGQKRRIPGRCDGTCERYRAKKSTLRHYVKGDVYCISCRIFISRLGCNDKNGRTARPETRGVFCKCCGRRARSMPHRRKDKEVYREERGIRYMP